MHRYIYTCEGSIPIMVGRSEENPASIRRTVEDKMTIGDRYNLWEYSGKYITPGYVVGREEVDGGCIVAIGKDKAQAPAFLIETVTDSTYVMVHIPKFDDEGDVEGFRDLEYVDVLQRKTSELRDSYPATSTFREWVENGNLPG